MSVNRFVCTVLSEMRTAVKVGRIDMLQGLIEEAQTLVNRMEAKLHDYAEMDYDLERHRENKKRYTELRNFIAVWEERVDSACENLTQDS